jgi:hypothetical protein
MLADVTRARPIIPCISQAFCCYADAKLLSTPLGSLSDMHAWAQMDGCTYIHDAAFPWPIVPFFHPPMVPLALPSLVLAPSVTLSIYFIVLGYAKASYITLYGASYTQEKNCIIVSP